MDIPKDRILKVLTELLDEPGDTVARYKVFRALEPLLVQSTSLDEDKDFLSLEKKLQKFR